MKMCVAVPSDSSPKNMKFFEQFEKSFHHFHPDVEVRRFENANPEDKAFWYRAKPVIAKQLFDEGYDTVVLADNDQIVLGDISHIWNTPADVAVVLNDPNYPISVWDIGPQYGSLYFNNGLVVVKNKEFVNHWLRLCNSMHFDRYQFKEQDILNILCSDYCNYTIDCLDLGDKIHGELAKALWSKAKMVKDKVMIEDKQLMVIHFGSGSGDPSKGKYKLRFQSNVVKFIDGLLK